MITTYTSPHSCITSIECGHHFYDAVSAGTVSVVFGIHWRLTHQNDNVTVIRSLRLCEAVFSCTFCTEGTTSLYPSSIAFHTLAIAVRHNNVSLLGCLHELNIGNGGSSRQMFAKLFFLHLSSQM